MPIHDPQEFARLVFVEILRLRGWLNPKTVFHELRGDVFKVMGDDPDYTRMWTAETSPQDAARAIQYRAWDRM